MKVYALFWRGQVRAVYRSFDEAVATAKKLAGTRSRRKPAALLVGDSVTIHGPKDTVGIDCAELV